MRAEPGCIEYSPAIDVHSGLALQGDEMRENVVMIIEKWESLEALHTHLKTPHMTEWFASSARAELAIGTKIQVLETVI